MGWDVVVVVAAWGGLLLLLLLHGVELLFLCGVGCHGFAVVFARGGCHCS